MCQQIVRVCPHCGCQRATCSPSPCRHYWHLSKHAAAWGYTPEQIKDELRMEDCPEKECKVLEFSPGACPVLDHCPSKGVMYELQQRKKEIEEARKLAAAELQRRKDNFIRLKCCKRPIERRTEPETFFAVGKRDVRARIHQEEMLFEADWQKQRDLHQRALEEITDMWREMDPDGEDLGAITSYSSAPFANSVDMPIKRSQGKNVATNTMEQPTRDTKESLSQTSQEHGVFELSPAEPIPVQHGPDEENMGDSTVHVYPKTTTAATETKSILIKNDTGKNRSRSSKEWFTIAAAYPPRRVYFKKYTSPATQPTASTILDLWLMQDDDGGEFEDILESGSSISSLCSDFLDRSERMSHEGSVEGRREAMNIPAADNTIHYDGYYHELQGGTIMEMPPKQISTNVERAHSPPSDTSNCCEASHARIVGPPPGLGFTKARVVVGGVPPGF